MLGGSNTSAVASMVVLLLSPPSGTFNALALAPLPEFALAALAPSPPAPDDAALPPVPTPPGPFETAGLLPHAAATEPAAQNPRIQALRPKRVSSHAIVL